MKWAPTMRLAFGIPSIKTDMSAYEFAAAKKRRIDVSMGSRFMDTGWVHLVSNSGDHGCDQ